MRVSPSQIGKFGDCARQWYYEKVLKLEPGLIGANTTLGSVFHYSMDVYETYNHDLDLAKKTFNYYWDHPGEIDLRIDFYYPRTSHESLRKRGIQMLDRYHELMPWKQGTLIGTEIRFEVPLGDHVLRGVIDKLFARPGKHKLEVVDFKTGVQVPKKLRYNQQFTSYCYATERPEFWEELPAEHADFEGWSREGWWYAARDGKMHNAGTRTTLDYQRLVLAVDAMELAVEEEVYPLSISGEMCGWCPYVDEVCGSEVADPLEIGKDEKADAIGH